MGLDSPREEAPIKSKAISKPAKESLDEVDGPRSGGAKSLFNDLLGGDAVSKHLETPGSGGQRREFTLDRKYTPTDSGWYLSVPNLASSHFHNPNF